MIKRIIILILILFLTNITSGQVKISGTIKDGMTNSPLEFISVSLLKEDSTFIKSTTSNNEGQFIFEKIKENNNYIISTSYIGYERTSIAISNLNKNLELGDIFCLPSEITLEDVTVTASSIIRKTDRQIILPSESQIKASSNGFTLLKKLQLTRIIISPIDNSIKISGGEDVQLRINGIEVSLAEIIALKPSEIIKIEYHDNPGMRYNNAGAVLDYITRKKESGGNISTDLTNGISNTGWGENYLSAKYNHRKSEFSTNAYWGRRDLEWTRENYETFFLPNTTLQRTEVGAPTKVKYEDINLSLNYNLQESDKYLFNVRLRNNHNNTPNAIGDRESTLYQDNSSLSIQDHSSSRANIPSLDIYYQNKLKNNQQLIFNIVGTYMDNKNTRVYQETRETNLMTDIYSHIRGYKYSLISEGIYERQFKNRKISVGIKHSQFYTNNKYTGDINNDIGMNTAETYGYLEFQFAHKNFNYMFGIGEMRTYSSQGNKNSEKYLIRPTLSITYNVNDNIFLRYNGFISGYAASLSELNNVEQSIDSLQIKRGNPNLKTVRFYANTLTASWNKGIFGVELFARYSYDHKPIMENVFLENGKVIRTNDNQKGFHRINTQAAFRLQPFKDYISINVTPFFNRYISKGNDYIHTHSNWGIRGSLMVMYRQWNMVADVNTSNHNLWGETLSKEERSHSILAGYNTEKWSLSAGVLNPFSKRYEQETQNLSILAPNRQLAYSDKLSPIFIINLSINLSFGRWYNGGSKRLDNKDTDAGILSGKK